MNTGTTVALIAETLIYKHTTRRTLLTCGISLDLLNLPAPEAGDLLELILLCVPVKVK